MFAMQTRDLSHIELTHSDNISSLNVAKAYQVNEVDISTEKREQEYKEKILIFLLSFLLLQSTALDIFRHEIARKYICAVGFDHGKAVVYVLRAIRVGDYIVGLVRVYA